MAEKDVRTKIGKDFKHDELIEQSRCGQMNKMRERANIPITICKYQDEQMDSDSDGFDSPMRD